jgi:hypothetical protein
VVGIEKEESVFGMIVEDGILFMMVKEHCCSVGYTPIS